MEAHYREGPDLVVLDWMISKLDRSGVLGRIHEAPHTPVPMPAARREEVDRVMCLEVDADDYLTKPSGTEEYPARALLRGEELLRKPLAREPVEATNGSAGAEGEPGSGSRFTLRLPRA